MKEHFYRSPNLGKEELKALLQRKDGPAWFKASSLVLLFLASSALVVWSWGNYEWLTPLAICVLALCVCSNFAGLHELVHNTAFRSRSLNRAYAFIFGILHIYPPCIFRDLHFTHHRYTHIPGKDPEISLGGQPAPDTIGSLPMYLGWLSGLPLLMFKLFFTTMGLLGMPEPIRKKMFPYIRPEARLRIFVESLFILGAQVGIVLLALWVHPGFWGILIGQVVGHAFLATYLTMEHNGLPHEGDILDKTRSMRTNGFVRALMWNMPYHAEHHAYPAVPYYALPRLHEAMKGELKHDKENHFRFHSKVLGRLLGVKKS